MDESRLPLTPDSGDTRELSITTSEDDIIGIALIEAYSQEVNIDETSESYRNGDVFVSWLQEDASFPTITIQTQFSEHGEGVDAASFAEEQRSCPIETILAISETG